MFLIFKNNISCVGLEKNRGWRDWRHISHDVAVYLTDWMCIRREIVSDLDSVAAGSFEYASAVVLVYLLF